MLLIALFYAMTVIITVLPFIGTTNVSSNGIITVVVTKGCVLPFIRAPSLGTALVKLLCKLWVMPHRSKHKSKLLIILSSLKLLEDTVLKGIPLDYSNDKVIVVWEQLQVKTAPYKIVGKQFLINVTQAVIVTLNQPIISWNHTILQLSKKYGIKTAETK